MTLIGSAINMEGVKHNLASDPQALLVHVLAIHANVVNQLDFKVKAALGAAFKSDDAAIKKLAIEAILDIVANTLEPINSNKVYSTEILAWEDNHDMFTSQFFGFCPA